ncbi:non-specific lipid transfer protein GPI-anchored 15 isoform X1 [Cryptomeria japonica]|uniref:non-specific lipid transfer protein GPI-anchored 15 isoform X1 n=1 Tax=Cryptomeria japonica TaxID=3369 RepID=UPI0027DA8E59|nr:non-specific lipid transfer protein GPI-anchored 15 isoform X1 [Cryptomeria japonica]
MAGAMKFPQTFLSVVFTAVVIIAGVANFGSVAAQSSGCGTSLATLSPCMGYITSNVTTSLPPQSCCTALSSVVQSNAVCLCQLLTTNSPLGFPINQTQALALPGACKITSPALTQCKAVAGAPAPSPAKGSRNGASPATGTAPSSSPATPNAVSPSSNSPSLLPPTTSVGGVSPTASEKPTSNAGTLFTPSMIISALAVAMAASSMW